MFVTDDMIHRMGELYGHPVNKSFSIPVGDREYDYIRSTQKHGRDHDFTLYIRKVNRVVVIAKHFYPPGLYRAPSGGLNPGEDFHDGINREALEETGCEIGLKRFLLQTAVDFTRADHEAIHWRSFVFLADYTGGDFKFTDHYEIREVRLADWSEFETFGRIMRKSDKGGLHYRAALHEAVAELL
jgi:ADP-ribose pyrophosphatase YjhB (NUDIX family)